MARILETAGAGPTVEFTLMSLLISLLVGAGFALVAYGAGVLDRWGSLLAFALALVILQSAGYVWLILLIVFVAVGYGVTKLFWAQKAAMGVAEGKTGMRGWRNVAANGGTPAILALLTFVMDERTVALGFIASVATASADTFASELGVLSNRVYLITNPGQRVERGMNGGVSNFGHAVALGGASIAGVAGAFLLNVPLAWAWVPILAGWLGCQLDSVLGALFEEERGRAYGFLSKSDVNFLSQAVAGFGVLLLWQLL